jgi:hypothetical protein
MTTVLKYINPQISMQLPVPGERVLFCAHADVSEFHIKLEGSFHWYHLGDDNEATDTRTGDVFKVQWAVLCEACHRTLKTPEEVADRCSQDAPWIGGPPDVTRYA